MPRFDALTFLLASGVMFLAMPLTVWLLLRRRQPPQRLNLWCLSGLAFSLSLVLFGLRAQVPDLLSIHLANALLHACVMLMIAVLRLAGGHAGHVLRWMEVVAIEIGDAARLRQQPADRALAGGADAHHDDDLNRGACRCRHRRGVPCCRR